MLTDAECKNATSEGLKIRKLPDSEGLYLWVYVDGRKYWRLRYWIGGKEKGISLGVYPRISLKDARTRRNKERAMLDSNLDPSAERRAEKVRRKIAVANSFEAVAKEWHGKQARKWVTSHSEDVLRRLEVNLFPKLGRRPISEITAPELLEALQSIEQRGSHDLAHRVLQVAGQVFRYAIATSRRDADPSRDLRGALTAHVKRNQPAVRPEQLPDLLRAIAGYDKQGDRQTQLAIELLALTFVRTNELINSEWPEFDVDAALWTIPAVRMKAKREHLVPLSTQAVAILKQLKALSAGSRFVLPGRNRDKPISNNTMLFALYRLGYKGRMTGHGFRAVASTILNEKGAVWKIRSDVIEAQLAHRDGNDVRGAYNRAEYLPERTEMMQRWSDHLDALRQGAKISEMKSAA